MENRSALDSKESFEALLTDLSKAFDRRTHELLLAKLNAYGFSLSALVLIRSYLFGRQQRTKVNTRYGSCEEILFGFSTRIHFGTLLCNIFICDLFTILKVTVIIVAVAVLSVVLSSSLLLSVVVSLIYQYYGLYKLVFFNFLYVFCCFTSCIPPLLF